MTGFHSDFGNPANVVKQAIVKQPRSNEFTETLCPCTRSDLERIPSRCSVFSSVFLGRKRRHDRYTSVRLALACVRESIIAGPVDFGNHVPGDFGERLVH